MSRFGWLTESFIKFEEGVVKMSIKVLTVEDSTLMRTVINDIIQEIEGVELIGTAQNGKVALSKIQALKPDIVTLDVEMPVMNGLETLENLRGFTNIPVIMLSARSDKETTLQALENGAQDFITKPEYIYNNKEVFKEELATHIQALVKKKDRKQPVLVSENPIKREQLETIRSNKINALVIGASTGGPKTISSIIQQLPKTLDLPVFIVQHMPKGFTNSFARRLNDVAAVPVVEAKHRMLIENGKVYIAPGGYHMVLHKRRIQLLDSEKIHGVKPAVDPLFETAVGVYGHKTLGVILTGMGKDGAQGCIEIKKAGGYVIAQDEATSVVYGMPKFAAEAGAVDEILGIDAIKTIIKEIVML